MEIGRFQRPYAVGQAEAQQESQGELGAIVAVEMHFRQQVAEGNANEGCG